MAKSKPQPLPHVTCLMETSVDGKIMVDRWPNSGAAERAYEKIHDWHRADAWLCGRVTMAYFARTQPASRRQPIVVSPVTGYEDFISATPAKTYAVAVDAAGKLRWKGNAINGDRLIVLLTRRASRAHLRDLRAKDISYLIAGKRALDFPSAFARLRTHFAIKRLMVEGGGRINASILQAGLIHELSLLLAPVIDGDSSTNGLFETEQVPRGWRAQPLSLIKIARRPSNLIWLRYRVGR